MSGGIQTRLDIRTIAATLQRHETHPLAKAVAEKAVNIESLRVLKASIDRLKELAENRTYVDNRELLNICLAITETCGTVASSRFPVKRHFEVYSDDREYRLSISTDTWVRPPNCHVNLAKLNEDKHRELQTKYPDGIPVENWYYVTIARRIPGYWALTHGINDDLNPDLVMYYFGKLLGESNALQPLYQNIRERLLKTKIELEALVRTVSSLVGEIDVVVGEIDSRSSVKASGQ